MFLLFLSAAWGFWEAIVFFIVPDVLLSVVALWFGWKSALKACAFSTVGAALGGTILFAWASGDPEAAKSLIDQVPSISSDMITRTEAALREQGMLNALIGSFQGTPYKVYASQAPVTAIHPLSFFLLSIPIRAIRFVLVISLVSMLARWIPMSLRVKTGILGAFWTGFYAFYFSVMPN